MWKCASRSLRLTFKKSVVRCSTVLFTKSSQSSNYNCLSKNSPALLEYFNRYYGYYKSSCGKFSQGKSDKGGPKQKSSFLSFESNLFDALRWGGIFLGIFCLQPFTKNKLSSYNFYENPAFSKLSGYEQTVQYIINCLGVQAYNNVLPEVKGAKSKKFNRKQSDESRTQNSKSDQENFNSLGKAHQKVLGTLNNWMGVQLMESGKHEQAFEYFKQAAEEGNTAGIFNLGICHEKGLGTNQNFNEAAEFYQKAAILGHATAMYNLGIFHIQGLGGVEPDFDRARELFEEAAKLGQADAEKALNLENNASKDFPENNSNVKEDLADKDETCMTDFICDTLIRQISLSSNENCSVCDSAKIDKYEPFECCENKKQSSTLNSDSGVLDLFSQNDLDIVPVPIIQN